MTKEIPPQQNRFSAFSDRERALLTIAMTAYVVTSARDALKEEGDPREVAMSVVEIADMFGELCEAQGIMPLQAEIVERMRNLAQHGRPTGGSDE